MTYDLVLTEVTFGTYYVRQGVEEEFERVLLASWDTLRRLGFIENVDPTLYRSVAAPHRYIEMIRWLPDVMDPAHEHPDLIPIWSKLGSIVEPQTPAVADRGLVFDEFVVVMPGRLA